MHRPERPELAIVEQGPRDANDAMHLLLPNVRETFIRDGLHLERQYTYKLCAPARASLLSGRWPHRAYDLVGGMRACKGLSPGMTNLAEKLRDGASYECHFVGKCAPPRTAMRKSRCAHLRSPSWRRVERRALGPCRHNVLPVAARLPQLGRLLWKRHR